MLDATTVNNQTRVLIVGLGSIGSRHLAVLNELNCNVGVCTRQETHINHCYPNVEDAVNCFQPNKILIANATADHESTLKRLLAQTSEAHILVEKPLFSLPANFVDIEVQHRISVAYNLRFHPAVLALRELLRHEESVAAQFYVGMYLPLWRPERDYRMSYSASVSAGGGVLRDLSHEIDLALWLFGPWVGLVAHGGHLSELEIETEDTMGVLFETKSCPKIALEINYLDRVPRRSILVHTRSHTYELDLIQGKLLRDGKVIEVWTVERNSTYRDQDRAWLNDDRQILCSFDEGFQVLRMIAAIEQSVTSRTWIQNLFIL